VGHFFPDGSHSRDPNAISSMSLLKVSPNACRRYQKVPLPFGKSGIEIFFVHVLKFYAFIFLIRALSAIRHGPWHVGNGAGQFYFCPAPLT